jgi:tetratricopeptide (TPR) repeat protein
VCQRVTDLDPLWVAGHHLLGFSLFTAGRFAEATRASARALEIAPDFVLSLDVKGFAELARGRHDDALQLFRRAPTVSPADSVAMAGLVQTNARMGRIGEAQDSMREVQERCERGAILTSAVIWAHCALGDVEEAIALLPRMVAEHDIMVQCLTSFAWWDPLRGDPRFEALLLDLKFPAYALAFSESRRVHGAMPVARA